MPGHVPALGQPDAHGVAAEQAPVVCGRDLHLRAHRLGHGVHEGQEPVRRPAGDDLQLPRVAVLAEGGHEVRAVLLAEDPADVG